MRMSTRLAAVGVLTLVAACGPSPHGPYSSEPIEASAVGIESLFEGECLDWRSFEWAKSRYESERAACIGEITQRSIEDCRANVTGVDWSVRASGAPIRFKVSYFFDEVAHPVRAGAMCEVVAPKELGDAVQAAVRTVTSKRRLIGPFKSGERGFSRPTLREYWVDDRGRPKVGVFYYPADIHSSDPVEKEHAAYPWTLTQFPEDVPIPVVPNP